MTTKQRTRPLLHHRSTKIERTTMRRRVAMLLLLVFMVCYSFPSIVAATATDEEDENVPRDWLIPDKSIVLIVGAAGFLGSELAMALHRTYSPKLIICVDSMETLSSSSSISTTTFSSSSPQEELALQEFKRQRAFRVMQTLGSRGVFYRADIRPSIPEFFDVGQVPILDYIFRDYGPITHVVHLADPYHRGRRSNGGQEQVSAVPRVSGDVRAGMMESLLEQMAKVQQEQGLVPHFIYASSYEVYNYLNPDSVNPSPFDEALPLTTPSSLRGAGKLLDELIAKTYYETLGLYSVGLRFFPVYGPWGLPGTPIFEMAERAVSPPSSETDESSTTSLLGEDEVGEAHHVRDHIYIDDAINAIMTAMQFRTGNGVPCLLNVGTGKGTTLREIAQQMERQIGITTSNQEPPASSTTPKTVAVAKMDRLSKALGFQPEVSLEEGILRTLAWHYDRTFPYGGDTDVANNASNNNKKMDLIRQQGILSCDKYDKECLLGAPIFPCSSECSHEKQCTPSALDDVLTLTRKLTSECETVLYTSQFDKSLERIPSATISPSDKAADSSIPNPRCNIAFVTEHSKLVQDLKQTTPGFTPSVSVVETMMYAIQQQGILVDNVMLLRHGIWTLIPVIDTDIVVGDEHIVYLLPKLSPGLFFGGVKTKYAIYADPTVVFKSIPNLLKEANMQPYQEGIQGATAMLIGHRRSEERGRRNGRNSSSRRRPPTAKESVQNAAYRMIQIGVVLDGMEKEDSTTTSQSQQATTTASIDALWMVHLLGREDSRLFRCDVFGEVVQWDVGGSEQTALEFIMGLHDMWSRVIVRNEYYVEPWWMGDDVVTTTTVDDNASTTTTHRRLTTTTRMKQGSPSPRRRLQDINGLKRVEITGGAAGAITGPQVKAAPAAADTEEDVVVGGAAAADPLEGQQEDDDVLAQQQQQPDDPSDGLLLPKKEGLVMDNGKDDDVAVGQVVEMDDPTTKESNDKTNEDVANEPKADETTPDVPAPETDNKVFDVGAEKSGTTKQSGDENKALLVNHDGNGGETDTDHETAAADNNAFVGEDKEDVVVKPGDGEVQSGSMDDEEQAQQQQHDEEAQQQQQQQQRPQQRVDFSSYDTWMGVLSSKKIHYFVRIVQSEKVGVVYLNDHLMTDVTTTMEL